MIRGRYSPFNLAAFNATLDHGALLGLADDDHPQYIKDSEFTQDSGILVGTGAGTFQEETGATLRTSIGVGTADSPQFTGLTLSGNLITTAKINFRDADISIGSTLTDGTLDISADVSIDIFYDNADVGDGNDGQSLYVNRRAAEGDDYLQFYINSDRVPIINANQTLKIQRQGVTRLSLTSAGVTIAGTFTDGTASLVGGALTGLTNLTVDNININGSAITSSSGNLVLDSSDTNVVRTANSFTVGADLDVIGDVTSTLSPNTDSNLSLGTDVLRWLNVKCINITDGTNSTTPAQLKAAFDHVAADGSSHSFIDQAVTVAGTPQFARLGIGSASASTAGILLDYAITAAHSVIDIDTTINPAAGSGTYIACDFVLKPITSSQTISKLIGTQSSIQSDFMGGYTGTVDQIVGIQASIAMIGNGGTGGTYTDSIWFRGQAMSVSAGSTIVNAYGLFLNAVTSGTTINRAIHSLGGDSVHAGDFTFGATSAPVAAVTAVGTVMIKEQAAADSNVATYGQLWIKNDGPNILMFTDDAGTDFVVNVT